MVAPKAPARSIASIEMLIAPDRSAIHSPHAANASSAASAAALMYAGSLVKTSASPDMNWLMSVSRSLDGRGGLVGVAGNRI